MADNRATHVLSDKISTLGKWMILGVMKLGESLLFLTNTSKQAISRPFRRKLVFAQMEFIGNESAMIIMVSGFFIGAVFSLQIGTIFQIFGAEGMMGAASGKALSRELSPLITAFLLAGKGGAAITAEIATMKVNEQVDAMEAMGVDPVSYLVVPRFIAALVMVPVLVGIFNFTGQLGSLAVGIYLFNVDQGVFFDKFVNIVVIADIWNGMQKAVIFGGIIALIACQFGLKATGGAKGVGIATTNSVVTTLLVILGVDLLVTYIQIAF